MGDPRDMGAFRCGVWGVVGAASTFASVQSRTDTGSSGDGVLSDFRTEAPEPAGDLPKTLVESVIEARAGPEVKLPVSFWHAPGLLTTPLGLAAKLCTG